MRTMNFPKKAIALLAATLTTIYVWADQSGKCGENVTYTFIESTGTLTISGTGAMKNYEFAETPWYKHRSSIKKAIIENGVTSIGNYAFCSCNALTEIAIPESVKSIGDCAFGSCKKLTDITIPDKIDKINQSTFSGCCELTQIKIPNNVTYIGKDAFRDCN